MIDTGCHEGVWAISYRQAWRSGAMSGSAVLSMMLLDIVIFQATAIDAPVHFS